MRTTQRRSCKSSTPPSRIWPASPTFLPASGRTSISAFNVGPDRGLDQLDRVVARPFGGAGDGADLAALFVDQQGGRHAEGAADLLQVLERLGGRIGVIGELLDAHLLQPGFRLVGIAGVDICLLYTSDAADDLLCVDLGGRRIIKKKNSNARANT